MDARALKSALESEGATDFPNSPAHAMIRRTEIDSYRYNTPTHTYAFVHAYVYIFICTYTCTYNPPANFLYKIAVPRYRLRANFYLDLFGYFSVT
jgi:hypothetical protein